MHLHSETSYAARSPHRFCGAALDRKDRPNSIGTNWRQAGRTSAKEHPGISAPVTIGEEWLELHPASPLKAEKTYQYVYLDLEPPLRDDLYNDGKEPNKGKGILMPDGDVINPKIEVIDQYGNAFDFVYAGSIGFKPTYKVPSPNELPRDREYKTVRIRSPRPIKVKAIFWFCDSSKDWP